MHKYYSNEIIFVIVLSARQLQHLSTCIHPVYPSAKFVNTVNPDKLNQLSSAVAMQVSQVNLFELGPVPTGPAKLGPVQISSLVLPALLQHRSHIQCIQIVWVYSEPDGG